VFKEQVEARKKDLKHYVSENKDKKDIIYKKKYDLDNHLLIKKENELKEKKENEKQTTEVNCTVPSTPWIHHVYDKRNEHYNILNRAEYSFSAKPSIKQNYMKCNTRFSANPKWRNTAEIFVGNELAPTYISEKERFNLDRNVGKDDKIKTARVKMGRENRIRTAIQKFEENNLAKQFLKEEKNKYSQMEKCRRQYEYEELFKNRNSIFSFFVSLLSLRQFLYISSFNLNMLFGCLILKIIIFPSSAVCIELTRDSLSFEESNVFSIFKSIFDSEKTLNIFDKQVLPPKTNKLNLWVNLISRSFFISLEIFSNNSYI
jgi:hypothetical protein